MMHCARGRDSNTRGHASHKTCAPFLVPISPANSTESSVWSARGRVGVEGDRVGYELDPSLRGAGACDVQALRMKARDHVCAPEHLRHQAGAVVGESNEVGTVKRRDGRDAASSRQEHEAALAKERTAGRQVQVGNVARGDPADLPGGREREARHFEPRCAPGRVM